MKSKITAVILVLTPLCVYIALGRLTNRNYFFLPESDYDVGENDADAEKFWATFQQATSNYPDERKP